MKFRASECNVCGGLKIKNIGSKQIGGDTVLQYKCEYCNSVFFAPYHKRNTSVRTEPSVKPVNKPVESVQPARKPEPTYKPAPSAGNNALSPKEIFSLASHSIINIYCEADEAVQLGTGIFATEEYVLTNAHVLLIPNEKNKKFEISDAIFGKFSYEDVPFKLEFVCADVKNDIALLHSTRQISCRSAFYKGEVETGEKVYAIGNAKGLGLSIVEGLVSNSSIEADDLKNLIMFSAPVNHGNSGGPLYNEQGKVIGIVTSGLADATQINYAIPYFAIHEFIKTAEEKEDIKVDL